MNLCRYLNRYLNRILLVPVGDEVTSLGSWSQCMRHGERKLPMNRVRDFLPMGTNPSVALHPERLKGLDLLPTRYWPSFESVTIHRI